jgi:NosL
MSWNRSYIGSAVLVALALGLAYLGWSMLRPGQARTCHACGRPVHEQALTIGLDDGHKETYCCLSCALTHHQQSGKTVEIVELSDYSTGKRLAPEQAYIVRESDVNLCMRHPMLSDREGNASAMEFDRCSPSMLAFASRERAEEFQRQHGGILLPFSQMHRAFETR